MAKPDFQTRPGHAAGTKGQPPQPDREAPSRPQDLTADKADSPENSNGAADDANAADWGLDTKGGGLSRETKIGLALIAILLCAFTLVVYKRIDQARDQQSSEEAQQVASSDDEVDPASLRPAASTQSLPVVTGDAPTFEPQPHNPAPPPAASDDPFAALALEENPPAAQTADEAAPLAAERDLSARPLAAAQQMEPPPTIPQGEDPFAFGALPQQSEPTVSDVQLVADRSELPAQSAGALEVFNLFPADPAPAAKPAAPAASGANTAAATGEPAADEVLDPFAPIDTQNASMEPGHAADQDVEQGDLSQPQQLPEDVAGELLAPGPSLSDTPASDESPVDSGRVTAGSTTTVLAPGVAAAQPVRNIQPVDLAFEEPTSDPFGDARSPRSTAHPPEPLNDLLPQPSPVPDDSTPAQTDSPGTYTVRPGDSFWLISRRHYGTARYYMALARYNSERIADPGSMRPGMKVLVPDREALEAKFPDLFPPRAPPRTNTSPTQDLPPGFAVDTAGRPIYRTGAEDTLSAIAERHLGRYSRWIQIYEMNRSVLVSPDDLKVGTTLRLPADATPSRER